MTIERDAQGISLKFGFNDAIKNEVKIMEGARWHPESKGWVVKPGQRNDFAIDYLLGKNPYAPWDEPVPQLEKPNRGKKTEGGVLYGHQCDMGGHMAFHPGSISAAEMGTGKTLTVIEVMELLKSMWGEYAAWFVAPKVALLSVKIDFRKWKAGKSPNFFTLHEFTTQVKGINPKTMIPPRVIVFDEASKLKNPQAKISQAAKWMADWMREYWQGKERVILMSGSPAPKSPLDWWMLCEIARPGFLREGTPQKFLDRIALVKKVAGETGVAYPKIITFKDDVRKCATCGRFDDHEIHKADIRTKMTYIAGSEVENQIHEFVPSVNEVSKMYTRMDGLVRVYLKKDCMDLPEKVYRVVKCKVTKYMKALAKTVAKTAGTSANALLLLRELSDGFQYQDELIGTKPCPYCTDSKSGESTGTTIVVNVDETGNEVSEEVKCIHCAGKKVFKEYKTTTVETETPKVQALLDILEEKDDDGRIVVYGAFQGTIDRICATVTKAGWQFIRRDGRGWYSSLGSILKPEDLVAIFQREKECSDERIAFVGHPKSCGMGLTLTASDTELYYSNSFDAEDRIQSEDRIHRHGSRGCNIIDLEHLPVDKLVRENLAKKRELQSLTMGEITAAMELEDDEDELA